MEIWKLLVILQVALLVMLLLLQLPIVQKAVRGNAVTATTASNSQKLGGKVANDYKLKGDFAILTGTVTGDETEDLTKDITFPTGFNNTNCVVISSMLQNTKTQNATWGTGTTLDTASYVRGTLEHCVYLNNSGVHIEARNIMINNNENPQIVVFHSNVTFNYKIVLMKIS